LIRVADNCSRFPSRRYFPFPELFLAHSKRELPSAGMAVYSCVFLSFFFSFLLSFFFFNATFIFTELNISDEDF